MFEVDATKLALLVFGAFVGLWCLLKWLSYKAASNP